MRQLETWYGKPDEAVRTVLGWSICRPIDWSEDDERCTHFILSMSHFFGQDSDFNLRSFWEVEKIPEYVQPVFTSKEQQILEEIERTTVKVNNRYQVKIPWKKNNSQIPESYDMDLRQLESTERRLKKPPLLQERYTKAKQEYENRGYVEWLKTKPQGTGWYLPYHPVVSEEKKHQLARRVFILRQRLRELH